MSFKPPAWAWLATAATLALLLSLGHWQVRRAQAKQDLQAGYAAAARNAPVDLAADLREPASGEVVAVRATGRYVADRQMFLDNQTHEARPGYHVWTPFRLVSGALIVVDRGWVPLAEGGAVPAPAVDPQARTIRGLWRDLPRPGIRLDQETDTASDQFPVTMQYPTAETLGALLGEPIARGVLLLDPAEADGFVREWNPASAMPPSRHYAYAAQWFALAATLVTIFLVLNLKRTP